MHRRFSLWMITAALVAMTLPVAAHHGWSGQGDEEFQLSGTLAAPVSLAGHFSNVGKALVIGMMFMGRIGPLTLAVAIARSREMVRVRHPEGKFLIG